MLFQAEQTNCRRKDILAHFNRFKQQSWDFPGIPVVKITRSNAGRAHVQSLVGKLESHMPHGSAKRSKQIYIAKNNIPFLTENMYIQLTMLPVMDLRNKLLLEILCENQYFTYLNCLFYQSS